VFSGIGIESLSIIWINSRHQWVKELCDAVSLLLLLLLLLLLFNGAPAHVGPRPPLMRFRNITLIDNW
jgi:hypothetical protein